MPGEHESENLSPLAGATASSEGRRPSLEYAAPKGVRGRRDSRLIHLLIVALVFYGAWCGLLYYMQDSIVFPRKLALMPRPDGPPDGTLVLRRPLEDGQSIEGWLFPALRKTDESTKITAVAPAPAPLMILFHGNAEIIDYQDWHVEHYRQMGYAVFLPEFRGYGRAAGEPSQRAIVADIIGFYDELVARPEINAEKVIFHGWSIGGAIAAQVAIERHPQAMILQSTPASIAEMSWRYGAPGFLVKHPFRTEAAVKAVPRRVLIIHGENDEVIPISHAHRLAAASPLTQFAPFDSGHNDLPNAAQEDAYWQRIEAFLKSLKPQRRIANPWQGSSDPNAPKPLKSTGQQEPDKPRPTLLGDDR